MRWGPIEAVLKTSALVLLLVLAPAAAIAQGGGGQPSRVRALLIGVGRYPNLPAGQQLLAPEGDARRLARALVDAGLPSGGVMVMTEETGMRPTRAAILAQLARLGAEARSGDSVLVYFSGHGDQSEPAPGRRAANLFLAADAGTADRTGARPGAVTDAELRQAFAAILANGADVWFIADTCHAYGLVRAASGRVKSLSHAGAGAPAPHLALRPERAAAGWGRFTGFYAAGEGALALERRLPLGSPQAEPASVFTYALVRAIGQGRLRSFRDLALATTAAETDIGPDAPAPVFEGELDRALPALKAVAGRQFALRRTKGELRLAAGSLEGFDPGAQVDLLGTAGQVVGRGRVMRAGLSEAVLSPNGPVMDEATDARLAGPALPTGATRGERLLELAGAATRSSAAGSVRLETWLWRSPGAAASSRCPANPPLAQGAPAAAVGFDPLAPPTLRACDVIYLSLRNTGAAAVDASPLYVDAAGRIGALALSGDDVVRLAPGEAKLAAVRLVDRDRQGQPLPKGVERLVVFIAAADPDQPPADLRTLAEADRTRGRGSRLLGQVRAAVDESYRGEGLAWRAPEIDALVIAWRLP